jgi:hypothetical protein
MKHTIASWDCSYREFFHLIDGLLCQKYDRQEFELIYVEQRKEEFASSRCHRLGLKSLRDRYEEVKDFMNIRVVYLGEEPDGPYHLGKCNNKAIELATGDIISVMDGDMLLPPDFLSELEQYHWKKGNTVVNLFRHMAQSPVGVEKKNWTQGIIDFEQCLQVCSEPTRSVPRTVDNKGPMISALKEHWNAVDGYDLHPIWSTGLSRLGQDVNTRLEILTGTESTVLPDVFAVHPYHPTGFDRRTSRSQKLLELQRQLIDWAIEHEEHSWKNREAFTEKLYESNKRFIDSMIYSETLSSPGADRVRLHKLVLEAMDVSRTVLRRRFSKIGRR